MAPENASAPATGYVQPDVDVPSLTSVLDGEYAGIRDLVRTNLATYASVLEEADELGIDAFRDRVRDVVVKMAATGQTGMGFPAEYGGGGDVGASIAAFETLAFGDLSVLVKVGVQFGLFGGAILQLGTGRHHAAYLPGLITGELMGCFAMTETGHGSNVQALGTVARYDTASREFVITTPGDHARKDYIGNAARHAELAVVFAQLEVDGRSQGVHAFVVPIRVGGETAPGVRIEDDGRKMGLNGVDNGRIWFDGVRVPREALLNRFADVSPEGVYESAIDNPNRRFFTMLGTLVQGRVSVAGAGISVAKVALSIATKYAVRRRQFEAAPDTEEQLLLDYGLHQRRLLPLIARTYALHFAQDEVRAQLHEVFSGIEDDAQARQPARIAGRGHQGPRHLARHRRRPGVPRGVRRRRPSRRQPVRRPQGRQRRLHHLRGRQPRPAPARGQGAAHRSRERVRGPRPARHGPLRHRPRRRDGHRADLGPQTARTGEGPAARRRRMGPGSRPARLGVPARHGPLPRGAHAGRPGPADQARDRPEARSGRRLLAGAGPRHRGRAGTCRATGDRGLRRQGARTARGGEKTALALLCDLFALSTIEADRAWFMEHGRLTVQRSKAISREVNDLCRKVRPLAVDLVDAWGIPAAMLRAPDLVG